MGGIVEGCSGGGGGRRGKLMVTGDLCCTV